MNPYLHRRPYKTDWKINVQTRFHNCTKNTKNGGLSKVQALLRIVFPGSIKSQLCVALTALVLYLPHKRKPPSMPMFANTFFCFTDTKYAISPKLRLIDIGLKNLRKIAF